MFIIDIYIYFFNNLINLIIMKIITNILWIKFILSIWNWKEDIEHLYKFNLNIIYN